MHPETMERNIVLASEILRGRTQVTCRDYREVLPKAKPSDLVYMDPPYQGVSRTHDHRYCQSIEYEAFVEALSDLNSRDVPFIVSYDGRTGAKVHGRLLPKKLSLVHIEVLAGRSTQATLLGRNHYTYESLYLSPALMDRLGRLPPILKSHSQTPLFAAS
jgi:DNA adenine methylase